MDPASIWKAALIGFPLGGFLWGATMWYGNEFRFKKKKAQVFQPEPLSNVC